MQIVLELPKSAYESIISGNFNTDGYFKMNLRDAFRKGKILPKGHGDLIDRKLALSDDGLCEFHIYNDYAKMRNYLKSIPIIVEAESEE